MKREEFYFDSRNGEDKIRAVRYTPENATVRCVVQIVHGMAEHVDRYEAFAEALTEQGFLVTAQDHLGHGKSVAEGGTYGYFCEQDPATVLVRDVHRLKKITQSLYPGVPYIIIGHSMGSYILRSYICRYGSGINGAIMMGTGMSSKALVKFAKLLAGVQKLFCGSHHVAKGMHKMLFRNYNCRIANPRSEVDWLTQDEACVDKYLADPLCGFTFTVNGFATIFELMDRIGNKKNLNKIPKELPIYILYGGNDPVGEYGSGVQIVYRHLHQAGLTNLQMKIFRTDRHELINEPDRQMIIEDICNWINSTIGA